MDMKSEELAAVIQQPLPAAERNALVSPPRCLHQHRQPLMLSVYVSTAAPAVPVPLTVSLPLLVSLPLRVCLPVPMPVPFILVVSAVYVSSSNIMRLRAQLEQVQLETQDEDETR